MKACPRHQIQGTSNCHESLHDSEGYAMRFVPLSICLDFMVFISLRLSSITKKNLPSSGKRDPTKAGKKKQRTTLSKKQTEGLRIQVNCTEESQERKCDTRLESSFSFFVSSCSFTPSAPSILSSVG